MNIEFSCSAGLTANDLAPMNVAKPTGATHVLGCHYYRQRTQGGADIWCRERRTWRYMEDRSAKKAMKEATKL